MVLRKGKEKLRKPCSKCGELYVPSGRSSKLCNECAGRNKYPVWLLEYYKRKSKNS